MPTEQSARFCNSALRLQRPSHNIKLSSGLVRPLLGALLLSTGLLLGVSASAEQTVEPTANTVSTVSSRLHDFSNRASELALRAIGMIGIHYKYGGTNPDRGLDCSGLVQYVFKEAWNKDLPRTSVEMSRVGQKVDQEDLQPGDLVFYNTLKRGFSHVGIYLGNNQFIHSPSTGGQVRIESMTLTYWKKRFNGARRIHDSQSQQISQLSNN